MRSDLLKSILFLIFAPVVMPAQQSFTPASELILPRTAAFVAHTSPTDEGTTGTTDLAPTRPLPVNTVAQPAMIQPANPAPRPEGFHWGPALKQSLFLLGIQHSLRFQEAKTRDNLAGPFFKDWFRSVEGLHGWSDGDSLFTQYVGHPMQGAWSGYIEIQNDPTGRLESFHHDRDYWSSRLRALAFASAYEAQWHFGPISEATIGHVGMKPGTLGWSEMVTGPTGGFGIIVAEDALDQKLIQPLEESTQSLALKRIYRCMFNPNRSFANLIRWKKPWYRDTRPLDGPAENH